VKKFPLAKVLKKIFEKLFGAHLEKSTVRVCYGSEWPAYYFPTNFSYGWRINRNQIHTITRPSKLRVVGATKQV